MTFLSQLSLKIMSKTTSSAIFVVKAPKLALFQHLFSSTILYTCTIGALFCLLFYACGSEDEAASASSAAGTGEYFTPINATEKPSTASDGEESFFFSYDVG